MFTIDDAKYRADDVLKEVPPCRRWVVLARTSSKQSWALEIWAKAPGRTLGAPGVSEAFVTHISVCSEFHVCTIPKW